MFIYLDCRDLIELLERHRPCPTDAFEKILRDGGHSLALSLTLICELSSPLADPNATTSVCRLLNRLEAMPLAFLHGSRVPLLELREAVEAYTTRRECRPISPYVRRLDETVEIWGPPPTRLFLNPGLAETVMTLWTEVPEAFRRPGRHALGLRRRLDLDRAVDDPPSLEAHFETVIERDLRLYRIEPPKRRDETLASWIYRDSTRCPSLRLGYELYHQLLRNLRDGVEPSTFDDLHHVRCLPYVDFMTLDRRMIDYVTRVDRQLGCGYMNRVAFDLAQIISRLRCEHGQTRGQAFGP